MMVEVMIFLSVSIFWIACEIYHQIRMNGWPVKRKSSDYEPAPPAPKSCTRDPWHGGPKEAK